MDNSEPIHVDPDNAYFQWHYDDGDVVCDFTQSVSDLLEVGTPAAYEGHDLDEDYLTRSDLLIDSVKKRPTPVAPERPDPGPYVTPKGNLSQNQHPTF